MTPTLRYTARSDVGLIRKGNEDSGYAGPRLLLVADGMGGHAAGELASASVIAILSDLDVNPPDPRDVLTSLANAVDEVGMAISTVITQDPELTGMGTTVTGIFWLGNRIAIVHIGDSRAYLVRGGNLIQLTHDHTFVQSLIDTGDITEAEAAVHPRRSLLMRALDGINPVEPDLSMREARLGDRYLVCSDGLYGVLSAKEISAILENDDLTGCATALVELSLERGAPDNVTVVIADVVDVSEGDNAEDAMPVVVGAAGEPRVRVRLPHVIFPVDAQRDPDRSDSGVREIKRLHVGLRSHGQDQPVDSRSQRRSRFLVFVGIAFGLLLALALIGGLAARTWMNSQWYVAVNGDASTGTVAIFNGVEGSLLGVPLHSITSDSGLAVRTLPEYDQGQVIKSLPANDQRSAERLVAELRLRAAGCEVTPPPAGCPGPAS